MKKVKSIAFFLYYLTGILAGLVLTTAIYATVVVSVYTHTQHSYLIPMEVFDDHFTIFYPFSHKPFLLGEYSSEYLIISLVIVVLYGIFLWLLSNVFRSFTQQKLFTPKSITRLSAFYIYNFVAPVACIIVVVSFGAQINDALVLTFLHFMIGVFAYFMAAIFKQGVLLQEEQDLTL